MTYEHDSDDTSTLRLTIPNTKIVIKVKLEKLASSKAGTNGLSYKTICAEHEVPVKQSKYCPACGADKPLGETRKLYQKFVLKEEWISGRKPKGDGAFTHVGYLEDTTPREFGMLVLTPSVAVLQPADTSPTGLKLYAAYHATLCDENRMPVRVAQVRYVQRGASPRTVQGIIRPLSNGYLVFEERYRHMDRNPKVETELDFPALSGAERQKMVQLGNAGMIEFQPELFDPDPYRDSMRTEVFERLAAGLPPIEPVTEALLEEAATPDLLSLCDTETTA